MRASQLGSDEFSVIADVKDGGPTAPKLPDGFNVDLLFAISEARRRAQEDNDDPHQEDRVLVARPGTVTGCGGSSAPPRLSRSPSLSRQSSAPVVPNGSGRGRGAYVAEESAGRGIELLGRH
ncbi:hypothetical protein Shyd_69050 [Streptomyces hydrogenans]|uniref:Uncharacterized protein n=1 Tax=Streptomyces hydrogenans TaxID=1873719 RepID=A0ABQ3PKK3_9ACTN|nr:hypothetical protein Shyd_69050 [Streptomyces hydrogenans]